MSRTNGEYTTVYVAGLLEVDSDAVGVTGSRTFYAFSRAAAAVREHQADETTFLTQNHLQSAVAAFNDDTGSVSSARYMPWGSDRSSSGDLPSDHGFTGQVADTTDADSGGTDLLFYNARYYDPSFGAFTSPDPIVPDIDAPAALNRYAYVGNLPTGRNDPSGHCWWVPFSGESGCPGGSVWDPLWNVISQLPEYVGDRLYDEFVDWVLEFDGADVLEILTYPIEGTVDFVGFVAGTATGGQVDGACAPGVTCIRDSWAPNIFGFANGQTFDEVIVLTDRAGEDTLEHEYQHYKDGEQFGWVAYAGAYLINGAVNELTGGDGYHDNIFELRARQAQTGQPVGEWGWSDIFNTRNDR